MQGSEKGREMEKKSNLVVIQKEVRAFVVFQKELKLEDDEIEERGWFLKCILSFHMKPAQTAPCDIEDV